MTPEEFRAARHKLGLTGAEMGALLGYGAGAKVSISRLETGRVRITPQLARFAEALLLLHEHAPEHIPKGWSENP